MINGYFTTSSYYLYNIISNHDINIFNFLFSKQYSFKIGYLILKEKLQVISKTLFKYVFVYCVFYSNTIFIFKCINMF